MCVSQYLGKTWQEREAEGDTVGKIYVCRMKDD